MTRFKTPGLIFRVPNILLYEKGGFNMKDKVIAVLITLLVLGVLGIIMVFGGFAMLLYC